MVEHTKTLKWKWRSKPLLFFIILSWVDYVTSSFLVNIVGYEQELNPIVRLFLSWDLVGLLILKVAVIGFIWLVCKHLENSHNSYSLFYVNKGIWLVNILYLVCMIVHLYNIWWLV